MRGTDPENKNMGLSKEDILRMYEDIIMGTWCIYMPYTNTYIQHTHTYTHVHTLPPTHTKGEVVRGGRES